VLPLDAVGLIADHVLRLADPLDRVLATLAGELSGPSA
jgi:hypothetical protein